MNELLSKLKSYIKYMKIFSEKYRNVSSGKEPL